MGHVYQKRNNELMALGLSLVIPVYNEEQNIKPLLQRIQQVQLPLKVLFVDGHSTDRTVAEIKKHGKGIKIIQEPCKSGLGSAYRLGFREALKDQNAKFFCEIDADLSHDPLMLPQFLEAMKKADIIIGSRYVKGGRIKNWPLSRRLISLGGSWLGRIPCRFKVKDVTSGFRMYTRDVLEHIGLEQVKSQGYAFQLEMLARAVRQGYKIKEVPITFRNRRYGKSKLGPQDFREYAKTVLRFLL